MYSWESRTWMVVAGILLAACGGTEALGSIPADDAGTAGTGGASGSGGTAGTGGAGGTAGTGGAGGTVATGGTGGTVATGGTGGTGGSESRGFTVTIENQTSESVFVDGLFLPYSLSSNGEVVSLFTWCNCNQCNTGESCMHGDSTPLVLEIGPNDSLEVAKALLRYEPRDVTESTCPELISWDPVCGEAHTLDAGTYQLRVRYDTLAAIEAQGLAPTTQTQWGHTVWMETSPGIGSAQLTMAKEDSIVLDDASPVVHTMIIGGSDECPDDINPGTACSQDGLECEYSYSCGGQDFTGPCYCTGNQWICADVGCG
jgi:hypothetical protein